MKPLLQAMKERRLYLDGGMGSMLQAAGLPEGLLPDVWGMQNPAAVQGVHRAYLEAGARLITTNTFGTSAPKLAPYGVTVDEVMAAAVANVRQAMQQAGVEDAYVCADLGPSGKLLRPYGDLDFEDAVTLFAETVRAAAKAGADCILIETMSDLYEMKAAVLAAKENCDLPILASLIFDATGKLLTGGSPRAAVGLLEGLGVDVLGINCGLGPKEMAPTFEALWEDSSTPLLLQPNAGLPHSVDGKAVYDVSPEEYAAEMLPLAPMATILGGCCGTTPAHIKALIDATKELPLPEVTQKDTLFITSYCQAVALDGKDPVIIGERINPTGKKKLQAALREGDTGYVLNEAFKQEEAGAHILDVNVGLPGLDEPAVLTKMVEAIQEVTGLPLQLDTSNPEAMERALRRYNGKPLINSVNGKEESLNAILPLVKKYGGGLVCLALDDNGIPATAEGRVAIAEKIIARAEALGIPRRELLVDGLTMPVSAGGDNAKVTLADPGRCKEAGGQDGPGRVQRLLRPAQAGPSEPGVLYHGPVSGLGRGHHQPHERGDDGGLQILPRPAGAGRPVPGVHDLHGEPEGGRPRPRQGRPCCRPGGGKCARRAPQGGEHLKLLRLQGPQRSGGDPGERTGRGRERNSRHHQRRAGPRPGRGGQGL